MEKSQLHNLKIKLENLRTILDRQDSAITEVYELVDKIESTILDELL